MANPVAGTRLTPAGRKLRTGFKTLITCALDTDIEFWEIEVKPPGEDGGDPIEQTTMHNVKFATFMPAASYETEPLRAVMPVEATVAYAGETRARIDAIINRNTTWTIRHPDGVTDAFFGFLHKFDPQPQKRGELPTATIMIQPSNIDPADTSIEAGPVLTETPGT